MSSGTASGPSIRSPVISSTQPAQAHSVRRYLVVKMLLCPSSQDTVSSHGPVFFISTGCEFIEFREFIKFGGFGESGESGESGGFEEFERSVLRASIPSGLSQLPNSLDSLNSVNCLDSLNSLDSLDSLVFPQRRAFLDKCLNALSGVFMRHELIQIDALGAL